MSGINRLDADIIEDLAPAWIAKEGADGLIMLQSTDAGEEYTILSKLASGSEHRYWAMAIFASLKLLNSKSQKLQKLQHYLTKKVQNFLQENQEFLLVKN